MKRVYTHRLTMMILLVVSWSCTKTTEEVSETPQPINPQLSFTPNILWLVAEDMSANIAPFGDSTIVTPTLDRLAAEGVCYDNFYTPAPVCSPARAAIITGMYPNSIGAGHMRTGPWFGGRPSKKTLEGYKSLPEGFTPYEAVPPANVKMFTEYLRGNGYYCTNRAKQDYQFITTPTAWDENGREAHWRNRPVGKPFFAVFNFGITHESQIWARAEDSLWVAPDLEVPVPPYLPDTEIGRQDVRQMYSNIKQMDYQIGQVLAQLEEDGLLDSTIVMWYTDHGGPLPRQKRLLHESGIKVPMIIRFPQKLSAGQRDDRMISFIDLAPTVMSLTGLQPPTYMDGSAFLGQFIRQEEPSYVFAAADRFDETYDRNRAVKDKRFKYIKYYQPEKPMFLHVAYRDQQPIMRELYRLRDAGQLNQTQQLWFRDTKPGEELFDTWEDPHEINNLAADVQYEDKLVELRKAHEEWIKEINDTGMIPEDELFNRFWPDGTQPITNDPEIRSGDQIAISCDTEGASIGYRLKGTTSWSLYSDPLLAANLQGEVEVIAHRIGYLPSKIVSVKID